MKNCPKCGEAYEGDACPKCGATASPSKASLWVKTHKVLLSIISALLVAVLLLSIILPVTLVRSYNGTYYLYEDLDYHYDVFLKITGGTAVNEQKQHGSVKVKNTEITIGFDSPVSGTIENDVITLDMGGTNVVYAKKNVMHLHASEAWIMGYDAHWKICDTCGKTFGYEAHTNDGSNDCTLCEAPLFDTEGLTFTAGGAETGYTLTGLGTATGKIIRVPAAYNGLPVTAVRGFAGEGVLGAETEVVILPGSITTIGNAAFAKSESLTSVGMPTGVKTIEGSAFKECISLVSITIPNTVTSIGDAAFYGCSSLANVVIPDSVIHIDQLAFHACTALTSVTLSKNVSALADGLFWDCTALKSITLPVGVSTIGEGVFDSCTALTSVSLPNSLTTISDWAFKGCISLKSVGIPWRVTTIGKYAFYTCSALEVVTFQNPNGWTYTPASGNTDPVSIASASLSEADTAATYLTQTYCEYAWSRS